MVLPCAVMIDWQMGQADANSRSLGAEDAVENMLQVCGGNARPVVKDGKGDRAVFIDRRLDVDSACRLSRLFNRLDAVDQQIDDHLLQLNPIAYQLREVDGP
jgi:hypothetical protein